MSRIKNLSLGAEDAHAILNFRGWTYDASSFFSWAAAHPQDARPIVRDLLRQAAAIGTFSDSSRHRLQGFWHAVGVSTDADYKQLRRATKECEP